MNDQAADREVLAEVIQPAFDEWLHRMHGITSSCRHETEADEIAAAILASPQFARIIAEAEARAWDSGYVACMDDASRSEMDDPTANPYRAALVAPDAEGLT